MSKCQSGLSFSTLEVFISCQKLMLYVDFLFRFLYAFIKSALYKDFIQTYAPSRQFAFFGTMLSFSFLDPSASFGGGMNPRFSFWLHWGLISALLRHLL